MHVKDIMTARLELVNRRATARDAARKMLEFGIGAMPVVDRGHLVGMLTDRDLAVRCVAAGMDPCTTPVDMLMTPEVVTCPEDQDVLSLVELMEARGLRRIVVVNARSKPVGIVSLADLAARVADKELVGEAVASSHQRTSLSRKPDAQMLI